MYLPNIRLITYTVFLFVLLWLLSACSQQDDPPPAELVEVPTATPTAVLPTTTPTAEDSPADTVQTTDSEPQVTLTAPTANQQFEPGQIVDVVSTAVDAQGITQVELLIDGQVFVTTENSNPQPNQPFGANQSWIAEGAGDHTLQVRATNVAGMTVDSVQISIGVTAPVAIETESSSTTEVEATNVSTIEATVLVNAIVLREGPSTLFPKLQTYPQGTTVTMLAKAPGGSWVKVSTPDGLTAWMSPDFLQFEGDLFTLPTQEAIAGIRIAGRVVDTTGIPISDITIAAIQGEGRT
ncbi:MAG: SH3 domain-containing protein, partial [Chloroflexota bacterium]